jgi:hypothetical protein
VITLSTALALASVSDGAEAFERGDLDAAIAAWEAVRADGAQPSGVVEYDLGVAWYRKGDMPRSISRFRAAERLRPRDSDVQHDLALARSELGAVPQPVGAEATWMRIVTAGELGVIGFLATVVGSAILLLAPRRLRPHGGAFLVGGLGLGALGSWGLAAEARHPVAVVVDQEVVLRDSASIDGAERLRLPPGTEVRVVRAADAFLLVEDGKGRRGWAPTNAVDLAWAGTAPPAG